MRTREKFLIGFLLIQCLILILIITFQYFQLGQVKKRLHYIQNKLDRILRSRNSWGFPMGDVPEPEQDDELES
ncbi:hypothetical protein ACFL35_09880 [Candidatus Riflebacteria bacterium]